MTPDPLRETFLDECADLSAAMAAGLRAIAEAGTADPAAVNAVFRAVHSIKGGAGAFGLDALAGFAHGIESAFDRLRCGRCTLTPPLLALLTRAGDHLADLVLSARSGAPLGTTAGAAILAGLDAELDAASGPARDTEPIAFTPVPLDMTALIRQPGRPTGAGWKIRFRPQRAFHANGHDAALILRELAALGDLTVVLDRSALPPLVALDWRGGYLAWSLHLAAPCGAEAIRDVFGFAAETCDLDIRPAGDRMVETAAPQPPPPARPEAAAGAATAAAGPAAAGPGGTIRIDARRLDRLIDLAAELHMHQAALADAAACAPTGRGGHSLGIGLDRLGQLSRAIQDAVLALRAQPVKPLFDRMHRILRDAAGAGDKLAHLIVEGEETELDRTMVERLAEPLTHLVRNAADHGIETPERRRELGKPPEGQVRLSAGHRSGRVLITLADDGSGIEPARVREMAVARGLAVPEAELSPSAIEGLLFRPGFSTAAAASRISGRGVGLDAVRSAVAGLGGQVSIRSDPGRGTTVTISLPLTIAVLDGLVVMAAGQRLMIPVGAIRGILRPRPDDFLVPGTWGLLVNLQGSLVPVADAAAALGLRAPRACLDGTLLVQVEDDRGRRRALAVDAVVDQQQVVVRPVGDNCPALTGIAATTVLGDGRMALILDTASLFVSTPSPQPPFPA